MVLIYIKCFRTLSFMGTWVLYEFALLVLIVAFMLFWVKMGVFQFFFRSFDILLNIFGVCVVSIDGLMLSRFLMVCGGLVGRDPICCSLLVCFYALEFLFMVLFPVFLLMCSFVTSTDVVLYPLVLLGIRVQHHISGSKETTLLPKLSNSRLKILLLILL
jgi:hypothetical protein